MFEKLFGKNDAENTEIKEPVAPVETIKASPIEIDPRTGVVMTKKEVADERKANLGDSTRSFDLK